MAITIDLYSDQLTQSNAPNYAPNKANEKGGKLRRDYFTYTFASEAALVNIAVTKIPAGARLYGGFIATDDLGTDVDLAVGLVGADGNGFIDDTVGATVADTAAFLTTAANINTDAVGSTAYGAVITDNFGYETAKEVFLAITPTDGGSYSLTSGRVLRGYIDYVVE